MPFHPVSFLLGLGAAVALPLLAKVARPVAVQLTVAGMELLEDVRRVLAEQLETMEDIAAEARARRDESLAEAAAESENGGEEVPERPTRRLRRQRSG
jgi:hypothetical protein